MNRLFTTAWVLAFLAVSAGAQRVSLEVPLSPTPGLSASAAALSPLANTFPLALTPDHPGLSAPSILPPFGAVPIPAAKSVTPAAAVPALAAPSVLAVPSVDGAKPARVQPAKVIDSLREHGALSGNLSGLHGEAGAGALENNFMAAASLGDGPVVPPAGDGAGQTTPPAKDDRPLLARMLERLRIDDRGKPEEKKAIEDAFKRMLETPTGRHYAEEFLAEGLKAHVHFEDFPDSQLYLVNGRKKFYAAQAYTDWRQDGYAEVRLNRHYIDGDADFMRESLPAVIGHELLGHGLWYGRAAKENLYLAFHYHELNETLARLVGWSIDHELDGIFDEMGAWNYLADPARYLANLKMRLPYYAVTFSQAEMAKPLDTLRARLAAAEVEVEHARKNLASQKTWPPVLEHFARDHGIATGRFDMLRKELADLEAHYSNEVVNAESIIREVTGLLGRIAAEPDHASEIYLSQSSSHAFFARLSADTERLDKALTKSAKAVPTAAPRSAAPRPADQFTWEELARMYRDDVAADAHRTTKHWR